MGEVKDLIAPETNVIIYGDKGQDNWYRSDVNVEVLGEDNEGGVGLEDTIYSLNGSDWFKYSTPIIFTSEGEHEIKYMSRDKADNKEEIKTIKLNIDKTPPEVEINANPTMLWPPNGKMISVKIEGFASDENLLNKTFTFYDEYERLNPSGIDFGQTILLEAKRNGNDLDGRKYSISVEAKDKAGNTSNSIVEIVVPHDQD